MQQWNCSEILSNTNYSRFMFCLYWEYSKHSLVENMVFSIFKHNMKYALGYKLTFFCNCPFKVSQFLHQSTLGWMSLTLWLFRVADFDPWSGLLWVNTCNRNRCIDDILEIIHSPKIAAHSKKSKEKGLCH